MVGISPQLQDPLSCAINHALFSVSFGSAEGESTTRLADAASASSQSETGTGTADPGDGFMVVCRKRRAPDRQASGKRPATVSDVSNRQNKASMPSPPTQTLPEIATNREIY